MNQVDLYQDETEMIVMKQETGRNLELKRNLSGDRSYATKKKWDDPILQ